jgi:ABC-2 type transport system ATP-binding protein
MARRPQEAGTETPALEVLSISKSFKGKRALDNATFSVKPGEIFGLLGPNGAGKTTIINCLCGLITPDSGSCVVQGKPVLEQGNSLFEKMNFVSGVSSFHEKETPRNILSFYSDLFEKPEKLLKVAGQMELASFLDKPFGELSTGQKTRVLLAKAILNNPKILLLDEPTLGLDPDISVRVRDLILALNKAGTTILLTSHYMPEVEELCDRIAFISDGRILEIGKVEHIKRKSLGGKTSFTFLVEPGVLARKSRKRLGEKGFSVEGNRVSIVAESTEVSRLISLLEKSGLSVLDMESRKPGLEEYFIKMAAGGGNGK